MNCILLYIYALSLSLKQVLIGWKITQPTAMRSSLYKKLFGKLLKVYYNKNTSWFLAKLKVFRAKSGNNPILMLFSVTIGILIALV